jgi:hypothetical protein
MIGVPYKLPKTPPFELVPDVQGEVNGCQSS